MVWIFGGGFDRGSINAKYRGSQWLMAEDIVLVEIQYRLNIFGNHYEIIRTKLIFFNSNIFHE